MKKETTNSAYPGTEIEKSTELPYQAIFETRVQEALERGEKVVKSTCWECYHKCGVLVQVKNGRVVDIKGNPEHPYNRGIICIKGKKGALATTYHPNRVLFPKKRTGERGEGKWERITWDEALEMIAERLAYIKAKHGPLSIAAAVSNAYFPRGVAVALLTRSIGTPNFMINTDLCGGSSWIADAVTWGDNPTRTYIGPDYANSKCILMVGTNVPAAHPTGEWRDVLEAKRKGVRIIVVDPRRTQAAKIADVWLPVRPGTDAALALGMANLIIEEGLYDKQFVEKWCYGFDKYAEKTREFPLERVSQITGVPKDDIAKAARLYATIKPAGLALRLGLQAQVNGVQICRAISCLLAISGNVDVPGGNLLKKNLPGFQNYHDFADIRPDLKLPREIEEKRIGARLFPLWCGPDSVAHACHNPSVIKAILTGDPYPIKAMYVTGVNIAITYPDTQATLEALRKLDFLVCATHTMTPVAELADLVLPKTTTLEEDAVAEVYLGKCVAVTQKAIEPVGECRDDWAIAIDLVEKLKQKGAVEKDYMIFKSNTEFLREQLKDTGVSLEEIREKGFIPMSFDYKQYEKKGFKTPTGKVELYSTTLEKLGYAPLPYFEEPPEGPVSTPNLAKRYPLILLTGVRQLTYHHSKFRDHEWARKVEPYPTLEIHPEAAAARGISDGDWVCIESPKGRGVCKQKAKITKDIRPDVVSAPMGWWYPEQPGPEHGCYESNASAAMSYGPPWDPIIGCASVKALLCQVTKVKE
jgi:thiosulfate reductase/polysulfide reductase chain A